MPWVTCDLHCSMNTFSLAVLLSVGAALAAAQSPTINTEFVDARNDFKLSANSDEFDTNLEKWTQSYKTDDSGEEWTGTMPGSCVTFTAFIRRAP